MRKRFRWLAILIGLALLGAGAWTFVLPRAILWGAARGIIRRPPPTSDRMLYVKHFGLEYAGTYRSQAWGDLALSLSRNRPPDLWSSRVRSGWPFCTYDTTAMSVEPLDDPQYVSITPVYLRAWVLRDHLHKYDVNIPGAAGNFGLSFMLLVAVLMAPHATRAIIACVRARNGRCRKCGYFLGGLANAAQCPECGAVAAS